MSEFIEKEESFKFGLLDQVPKPREKKCFLLYQTGSGLQNSMVIHHGMQYSTVQIWRGHYDKKVTVSLNEKSLKQAYQVAMKDQDFYFKVTVETSYYVQDVQEYFFQGKMEEDDMQRAIREMAREQDGKWDVRESLNLRNELEDNIERRFRRFTGVKIKTPEVTVTPDDAAIQILNSNRDTTVQIYQTRNNANKQIVANEQNGRIVDSVKQLKGKKIDDLANMVQNFGSMAPIMEEYFNGNIDGVQLHEYIAKAKSDNMAILNTAVQNDMLPDKEIMAKLTDIIGGNGIIQSNVYQQIADKHEDRKQIEAIKDEEDGEEAEDFSFADGDFI